MNANFHCTLDTTTTVHTSLPFHYTISRYPMYAHLSNYFLKPPLFAIFTALYLFVQIIWMLVKLNDNKSIGIVLISDKTERCMINIMDDKRTSGKRMNLVIRLHLYIIPF